MPFKKAIQIMCSFVAVLACASASSGGDDDSKYPDYLKDGLVDYVSDGEWMDESADFIETLDPFVIYSEEDKNLHFEKEAALSHEVASTEILDRVELNVSFMNSLANADNDYVSIGSDKELVYNFDNEYEEEWKANRISCHWWGWTYQLDSDWGMLVGFAGLVYNLYTYINGGLDFYRKMLDITDSDVFASVLSTIVYYLPGQGCNELAVNFFDQYLSDICVGLVSANLALMTIKVGSGYGWLINELINFIMSHLVPSLVTSCSMLYNCYRSKASIYCQIHWYLVINWSLKRLP